MRRLGGWAATAGRVLGSGWTVLTAGALAGLVAVVLMAGQGGPPSAPAEATLRAETPAAPPKPTAQPPAPTKAAPAAAAAAEPAPARPAPAVAAPVQPAAPAAGQLAALPAPPPAAEPSRPAWLRHAVAVPDTDGRPVIAVVIDDLGLNRPNTAAITRLPGPLTLAFLSYAEDLKAQTGAARRAGHELLVHMPMEPMGESYDPGPDVLRTGAPPGRTVEQLRESLASFDGYVGINNHMGSRFTASEPDMRLVLTELKRRGLLFLDSRTIGGSVAHDVAAQVGLPFAQRDVFLDNVQSSSEVEARLAETEEIARRRGHAIAIGHPHDATIEALAKWLPTLQARGFALVPVSAIVKRSMGVEG
ncbi:MAG: hypothetical protein BroJett029_03300 [Alphaproteobacteria bacterium]|nr:MAG: hypothetical protein BroJett029_03300 [Alphaproteobacteria bacterium]